MESFIAILIFIIVVQGIIIWFMWQSIVDYQHDISQLVEQLMAHKAGLPFVFDSDGYKKYPKMIKPMFYESLKNYPE